MTMLYVLMAMLTAGVCIKLVYVLSPRGGNAGVTRADRFLVGVIVMLLPAAALSLYLLLGRPDLKAQQAIFDMTTDLSMRQAALLAKKPMSILVGQNPDDIGAHLALAEVNRRIGRDGESVQFLARAVSLAAATEDPFLRHYAAELGQAQIRANKGMVGDDALETFAFVRSIYPEDPIARHFQTLAMAQRGDPQGAITLWRELLSEGAGRAYWKDFVRKGIANAERDIREGKFVKKEDPASVNGDDTAAPAPR